MGRAMVIAHRATTKNQLDVHTFSVAFLSKGVKSVSRYFTTGYKRWFSGVTKCRNLYKTTWRFS